MSNRNLDGSDPLPHHRHEDFAKHLAKLGDRSKAAKKAGYTGKNLRHQAYALLQRPDVAQRVEWLRRQVSAQWIQNTAVSREEVVDGLRENLRAAREKKDCSASNRALELLGKTLGMFVNVTERREAVGDEIIDRMTDDEVRQFVQNLAAEVGTLATSRTNNPTSDDDAPAITH
jgi:phage terminase small subunit